MDIKNNSFTKWVLFIYSIAAYVMGLGGLIYFILFIGWWDFLPLHVNSGTPGHIVPALLTNVGLILLFGLQHSVMARPSFKKQLKQIVPDSAERSTYVLLSGIMMGLICLFWQPVEGVVWQVQNPIGRPTLRILYLLGWQIAIVASFLINHFELFGLQQAYNHLTNRPETAPKFTERLLYRVVRHPLQLGVLMGIWFTPLMTMTHLMLAVAFTSYIYV